MDFYLICLCLGSAESIWQGCHFRVHSHQATNEGLWFAEAVGHPNELGTLYRWAPLRHSGRGKVSE